MGYHGLVAPQTHFINRPFARPEPRVKSPYFNNTPPALDFVNITFENNTDKLHYEEYWNKSKRNLYLIIFETYLPSTAISVLNTKYN